MQNEIRLLQTYILFLRLISFYSKLSELNGVAIAVPMERYCYDARGNVTAYTDAKGILFQRKYRKTDNLLSETTDKKGQTDVDRNYQSFSEIVKNGANIDVIIK